MEVWELKALFLPIRRRIKKKEGKKKKRREKKGLDYIHTWYVISGMYLYVSNTMYQVATHLLATSKMNATRVDEGLLHSTASFTMKYCCDRH